MPEPLAEFFGRYCEWCGWSTRHRLNKFRELICVVCEQRKAEAAVGSQDARSDA